MVIGNGLIANSFAKYNENKNVIIFASGVSNSQNIETILFKREKDLIEETINSHPSKTFVYFSTCSIYDTDLTQSKYIQHKLEIEDIIARKLSSYYIFRVSNIVGHTTNKNTLINYLANAIQKGEHFTMWVNAYRNLIDLQDTFQLADYIIERELYINTITNIANPFNYSIKKIVAEMELFYNKKANYTAVNKGANYAIDITKIYSIIEKLKIKFDERYLTTLLQKYY